ncbi:unnamed protein product [Lampetra fluviatilis]
MVEAVMVERVVVSAGFSESDENEAMVVGREPQRVPATTDTSGGDGGDGGESRVQEHRQRSAARQLRGALGTRCLTREGELGGEPRSGSSGSSIPGGEGRAGEEHGERARGGSPEPLWVLESQMAAACCAAADAAAQARRHNT